MKSIKFRVDGYQKIGLGHLIRSLSLAHILKTDFEIIFYCIHIPKKLISEFEKNDITVKTILNETEFIQDINEKDFIVLDGYHFNSDFQKRIKERCFKLICIDDLYNQHFYADIIINHAPLFDNTLYKCEKYTKIYSGLDYALLRPSFMKKNDTIKKVKNSLTICFGGSDIYNLTEKSLICAINSNQFSEINLIIGESNNNLINTKYIDNNINIYRSLNEKEMYNLLCRSEYTVVSASGILFESIACNCKTISGYYIENQKKIYEGFLKLNQIVDAKEFEEKSIQKAIKSLKDFEFNNLIIGKSKENLHKIFIDASTDIN